MMYRAAPPGCVRIVALDALSAVYDRRSGQTHLVTAPVVAILAAIGDDALDVSEIAERIGFADEREAVMAHLADLIVTGLVTAR